jgi:hypothetical protein
MTFASVEAMTLVRLWRGDLLELELFGALVLEGVSKRPAQGTALESSCRWFLRELEAGRIESNSQGHPARVPREGRSKRLSSEGCGGRLKRSAEAPQGVEESPRLVCRGKDTGIDSLRRVGKVFGT